MSQDNSWWQGGHDVAEESDAPTGRFNAEDMEFESFMFDPGSGGGPVQASARDTRDSGPAVPVMPVMPAMPVMPPAGTAPLPFAGGAFPQGQPIMGGAGAPDFAGEDTPLPQYLRGGAPGEAPSFVSFVAPNLSGPLSTTKTGSLAAYAPTDTLMPRSTGPLQAPQEFDAPARGTNLLTPPPEVASRAQSSGETPTAHGTGQFTPRGTGPLAPKGTGPLTARVTGAGPLKLPQHQGTGPLSMRIANPPAVEPATPPRESVPTTPQYQPAARPAPYPTSQPIPQAQYMQPMPVADQPVPQAMSAPAPVVSTVAVPSRDMPATTTEQGTSPAQSQPQTPLPTYFQQPTQTPATLPVEESTAATEWSDSFLPADDGYNTARDAMQTGSRFEREVPADHASTDPVPAPAEASEKAEPRESFWARFSKLWEGLRAWLNVNTDSREQPMLSSPPSEQEKEREVAEATPQLQPVQTTHNGVSEWLASLPVEGAATTTQWSDSSLAAIDDFSTVLIAMHASKRLEVEATAVQAVAETRIAPAEVEAAKEAVKEVELEVPAWARLAEIGEKANARLNAETGGGEQPAMTSLAALDALLTPPREGKKEIVETPPQPQAVQTTLNRGSDAGWGDNIQFEPFMFDGGAAQSLPTLPSTPDLMPKVQEMEAAIRMSAESQVAEPQVVEQQERKEIAPLPAAEWPSDVQPRPFEPSGEAGGAPPLPFWLRDTGSGPLALTGEIGAASEPEGWENPAVTMPSMPSITETLGAPPQEDSTQAPDVPVPAFEASSDLYDDLPPIDPFDFSMLQLPEIEDHLGFNTEELKNIMPSQHDAMRATADLSALADLLGTQQPTSSLFSAEVDQPAAVPIPATPAVTPTPAMPVPVQPSAPANTGRASGGWTSTVTSHLSQETVSELTEMLPAVNDTSSMQSTLSLTEAELDIDPFDFTDMNLTTEEVSTGYLDPNRVGVVGTGKLVERPVEESVDDLWDEDGTDTSLFMTRPQGRKTGKSTGWLGDANAEPEAESIPTPPTTKKASKKTKTARLVEAEQPAQAEAETSVKARVTNARWSERAPLAPDAVEGTAQTEVAEPVLSTPAVEVPNTQFLVSDTQHPTPNTQHLTPATLEDKEVTELTQTALLTDNTPETPEQDTQEEHERMDKSMNDSPQTQSTTEARPDGDGGSSALQNRDFTMSGPLPALDGFEELQRLTTRNPDDLGALMALASAYMQGGDIDTALRVYRRIVKKRKVTPTILQLINEEMQDLESEGKGQPHYHQLRGDVYMKQGRYDEAVQEYNKL